MVKKKKKMHAPPIKFQISSENFCHSFWMEKKISEKCMRKNAVCTSSSLCQSFFFTFIYRSPFFVGSFFSHWIHDVHWITRQFVHKIGYTQTDCKPLNVAGFFYLISNSFFYLFSLSVYYYHFNNKSYIFIYIWVVCASVYWGFFLFPLFLSVWGFRGETVHCIWVFLISVALLSVWKINFGQRKDSSFLSLVKAMNSIKNTKK